MDFIIFDLEATCWEGNTVGRTQEIIEIGAFRLDAYGVVSDSFETFIRPVEHPVLSVYCKGLTGIAQEDIDTARTFDIAGTRFMNWILGGDETYRLCSWGSKDLDLLISDCHLHQMETDWLEPYADLKTEYHQMRNLQKKSGLKRTLQREGLEFEGNHHRALDDARNLVYLFSRYFDMWVR
jgi:inhibitor of KinA sporulation pathway (predicted exonuclease)